jgi:hypothetical protein
MTHPAHYEIIGGPAPYPDSAAALRAAATRRDQVTARQAADMRRLSADTPGNDPDPARRQRMARAFLQAVGESLDEAWPELIARACIYAGMGAPVPGADEYVDMLAAALGVPADEAPFELDQLIPGVPDTARHEVTS